MQFRTLALATTSLVALGLTAQAYAANQMMGDLNLGYAWNWEDWQDDPGGSNFDMEYPSVFGRGRVNLPYSDTINVQLDAVGRGSLEQSFFSGKGLNQATYFALGGHINHRDDQGMLGVFGAVGRSNDTLTYWSATSAPIFMAGIEGQYYWNEWTFRGQLAYLDSDESYLLANAGSVRVGANYYVNKQLKLTGDVAYIDGELGVIGVDVQEWAWALGVHYWFGKSMPVSAFVEYRGRDATGDFGGEGDTSLEQNAVNVGVMFHFGGDGFQDADRNGASADLPDIDWYRLAVPD